MARSYETIVVFRPDIGDAQVKDEQKKIENLITSNGAKSVVLDVWGKKDIAYTVKKFKSGSFVCYKYESDVSDTVKNVTSVLRITDSVIKFQTHVTNLKTRKFKGNPQRPVSSDGDDFMDSNDDSGY